MNPEVGWWFGIWAETVAAAHTCSPELSLLRTLFPHSREGEIRSDLANDEEDDWMQLSFVRLGIYSRYWWIRSSGSPVNGVVLLALMRVVGIRFDGSPGNDLLLVRLVFAGSSEDGGFGAVHFLTKETDGFDGSARSMMGIWLDPPKMVLLLLACRSATIGFSMGIDGGGWSIRYEMGLMVDEQGWRRFRACYRCLLAKDGDAGVVVTAADGCSRSGCHGSIAEEVEVFDMAV
ncbi:hypothetical protein ACLOJK_015011 [Asimina triloba]